MKPRQDLKPASPAFASARGIIDQYAHIGTTLLDYESSQSQSPARMFIPGRDSEQEFAACLATVPVEVLEVYLDDLLDLNVSDESLFIKQSDNYWKGLVLGIVVASVAGVSLYFPYDAEGVFVTLFLGFFFFAGLIATLYFLPRSRVMRRFSFANLISRAISRRRGYDKNETSSFAPRIIRDLFSGRRELALENHSSGRQAIIQYFH